MNPLRRPRPWLRLLSLLALGFALWLLLVPRIALYWIDDDGAPYGIDSKYAWGKGTSDQEMLLPADMFGDTDPEVGDGGADGMVHSVRLNCGLVFTTGENEGDTPHGADACSDVERWPLIDGVGLIVLGIAGFVAVRRLRDRDDEEAGMP